jgi:FkbH-like protein
MPLLRNLADKVIARAFRGRAFESKFIRDYFSRTYDISVGLYTSAGAFDRWRIPPGSRIGRYCSISATARLIDANHPVSALSTHPFFYLSEFGLIDEDQLDLRPPVVEDDVWLSHNTTVLPSCKRVGRGSVIGAGSVVVEDVPRYAVMLGSPARLVRYRFTPEVIAAVEATRWWLLDKAALKRGCMAAPNFLTAPTVENAASFCAALGLDFEPATPDPGPALAHDAIAVPSGSGSDSGMMALVRSVVPTWTDQTLTTAFSDLGFDSLQMINLRMAAEIHSGRRIDDRAWSAIVTPADLLKLDPPKAASTSVASPSPTQGQTRAPADLYWLPALSEDFASAVAKAAESRRWSDFTHLSGHRLDLLQIDRLDREMRQAYPGAQGDAFPATPIKVAVLSSATTEHLAAGMRTALARRNLYGDIYFCDYGQYFQDLMDGSSALHAFRPDVVVFSLDAQHLMAGADIGFDEARADAFVEQTLARLVNLWSRATEAFGCQVIQQSVLQSAPALIGSNEHRLPGSPARLTARLNAGIEAAAERAGVDLLDVNDRMVRSGIVGGYDAALWNRGKQEIAPSCAAIYGDLVARLIATQRGLSSKCLVLDLDNTLWGGVIGDDGLAGIRLGQGSAEGEAHLALQAHARRLAQRGVILAVCSKNDESNALLPFTQHPEMILRRDDIACFVANWDDKPRNLRSIAKTLNIGLDSLVFVDDNAFERNLVRRELPMVATLELPEDPSYYTQCLADSGYFEQTRLTAEDFSRGAQYQVAAQQTALKESASDIESYLSSLGMELRWSRFDDLNLSRITQLINKTNQFNLTTRRYTEQQVREVMGDPNAVGLYFRLVDSFGDNGIIAVLIARLDAESKALKIDSWLMSCRVFGRRLEPAMLAVLLEQAKAIGAASIVGEYRPTAKNGLAANVFKVAGFGELGAGPEDGVLWVLPIDGDIAGDPFPGTVVVERTLATVA